MALPSTNPKFYFKGQPRDPDIKNTIIKDMDNEAKIIYSVQLRDLNGNPKELFTITLMFIDNDGKIYGKNYLESSLEGSDSNNSGILDLFKNLAVESIFASDSLEHGTIELITTLDVFIEMVEKVAVGQ